MKRSLFLATALSVFLAAGSLSLRAQVASESVESAVQILGSKTRAEIAKVSQRGADSDRALRFQEEGIKRCGVVS